jgi:molybdate transport system permease protein
VTWLRGTGLWVLAAVATALLGLPVLVLVVRAAVEGSLGLTLTSRLVVDALTLSLLTSAASLVVTICIGTPLAYLLARRRFPGAWLVEGFVDLPIVLPPSVAGLALLFTFGRRGAIGPVLDAVGVEIPFTTLAVVLAQTFVSAPFFIRAARAGFRDTNRDLEDAARADGAGEWAVFRSVTVPLANAALAAGLVLAWARALGEFGATIMFAGNIEGRTQTLPLLVYSEFQSVDGLGRSTAAAAVLVLAALAVLVAVRALHWRSLFA